MEADIHQARAGHFSVRSCRSHRAKRELKLKWFCSSCFASLSVSDEPPRREGWPDTPTQKPQQSGLSLHVLLYLLHFVATVASMSPGCMSASVYLFQHCVKVTPKPDVPVANRKSDIVYDVPIAFVSES